MNIRHTNLFLATGNTHKKQEFANIFSEFNIIIPKDVNIEFSPDETGSSFFENALIKAQSLYEITKEPVIADDSGLCVEALNDAPGIFSSRYANDNDPKTRDNANILKLLSNLDNTTNRKAQFICCLVIYFGRNNFFAVQETCEGIILREQRGVNGFGYDPIFYLPEFNKTMAEITNNQKNTISHRGKAAKKLYKIIIESL